MSDYKMANSHVIGQTIQIAGKMVRFSYGDLINIISEIRKPNFAKPDSLLPF